MTGLWILCAVAVCLVAFGVWKHKHDGRLREHAGESAPRLTAEQLGTSLGDKATLVQFTSAFCGPCRATRIVLDDVAGKVPGVVHVDLDVDRHEALVRQFDVTRTPTVLVLDADGAVVRRASGQPRKADVIAALGEATPA